MALENVFAPTSAGEVTLMIGDKIGGHLTTTKYSKP